MPNFNCPQCHEHNEPLISIICGHSFCKTCMQSLTKCTICQEKLYKDLTVRNYVLEHGPEEKTLSKKEMEIGNHAVDSIVTEIGKIFKLRNESRFKMGELFIRKVTNNIVELFLKRFVESPTEYRYHFSYKSEDAFLLNLSHKISNHITEKLSDLDVEVIVDNKTINNYYENGYYISTLTIIVPYYKY